MTLRVLLQVRPCVHAHLRHWTEQARATPSPELRKQALASIADKTFHCEGRRHLQLPRRSSPPGGVRFIVAYQIISDYLDNLCDRGTSLDPHDFRALHASMRHALTPGAGLDDYYRFLDGRDDGGYPSGLVKTCQQVLAGLPPYEVIAPHLQELADHYCALQAYTSTCARRSAYLAEGMVRGAREFRAAHGLV